MVRAFVGLGANVGDPVAQVSRALAKLAGLEKTRVERTSSLYRTAPLGHVDQPEFVNAVASLETALTPRELLDALLGIEEAAGRERTFRNAPRVLDLDLLLYGDEIIDAPGLEVPHPRMHERAFVLMPLSDLAPGIHIPGHGCVADLLAGLREQRVVRIDAQ